MHYLTREDLLDLHTFVIDRYGGLLGIASQDRLASVLQAPYQTMFGTELYPDICSKAAVLAYRMIKSHPFVSSNDSTALIALLRFLELNGLTLGDDVGSGDLVGLIRALNYSNMDQEELADWLRDHVVGL